MLLNVTRNMITVNDACIKKMAQTMTEMIARDTVVVLDMFTMIDLVNSVSDWSVVSRLHLGPIQFFLISGWKKFKCCWR